MARTVEAGGTTCGGPRSRGKMQVMSAGGRTQELDGVRGLAILLVLAGHAGANHWGGSFAAAGVTLFFVLSGYLITSILLAEHQRHGRIDLRTFYTRRLTRLGPPLIVMLIVTGAIMTPGWIQVLAAGTWISNYVSFLGVQMAPYGHTWSLAVEEQFYLVWPLLLVALLRSKRALWWALGMLAGLLWWRLSRYAAGHLHYGYGAFETAGSAIVAGCVVAIARLRLSGTWGWVSLGLLLVLSALSSLAGGYFWLALPLFVTPPAAGLVAAAGSLRWLKWRPLTIAGVASYSMYLWHEPVSHMVSGGLEPAGVVAGAAVGLAGYLAIERPLMRLRDRRKAVVPPRVSVVSQTSLPLAP